MDSGLREEVSESRRRVLDAANALFVEFGFKAVSMQQIANAAQITKATLYHHFRSKEELFAAVVTEAMVQSGEEIAQALAAGGTPAEQLVRAAVHFFARTHSDFGRLMTDVHEQLDAQTRQKLLVEQAMPWERFREVIRTAVARGDLPPVDHNLAISMFVGMVWGQIWLRKIEVTDLSLDETLAQTLVAVLFAGLRESFAPVPIAEA